MQLKHPQLIGLIRELDFVNNPKTKTKVCRTWAKILTKQLREYAKSHVRLWYSANLNKYTPFKVTYSRKHNSLIVWGLPPNDNVSRAKKYKVIPLGKETTQSKSTKYHWTGAHYRRVHINTSNNSNGMWITVKNRVPSDAPDMWYTKTSHTQYNSSSDGKYTTSGSHKYPFPVKWKKGSEGSKPQWCYQRYSVADNLFMRDEQFSDMYEKSLRLALAKMNLL